MKKRKSYPATIKFVDCGPRGFNDKPLTLRISKSPMVGDIIIQMKVDDLLHNQECWIPLHEKQIITLQKWLVRWRKSHEYNWGPIEK